jgi:hypothetical protein
MNKKSNNTIDEATRFLKLVNEHLKEKNCKHTIIEVVLELLYLDPKDEDALLANKILEKRLNYDNLVKAFPLYA